jgi:deoxyribodipyrimidine photo-lyase
MFNFPDMERDGFNPRLRDFPWRQDEAALDAWRRGRTGYPIVDAGMRELWTTGWMHNRARMVCASFLVKDLLIDWRVGERWFWDTLVDADLANNVGGWQWVAGSGADAAPYVRVFNPVLQGEKFDPDGDYVRRWAPELAPLPGACIHRPWDADRRLLAAAGVQAGSTYPPPIIDHAEARMRALAAYERP